MALSEIQQATKIIERSTNILLIVPAKASLDALAAMIALYLTFQSMDNQLDNGRIIDEVSASHVPAPLRFLAGSSQVKTELTRQPEIVLDMAGSHPLANINQKQLVGGTRIHLSFPANTKISQDQLETSVRELPYDVIVVIGASDLEELGTLFTDNADFFYHTPLINIDYQAANEYFGAVNLVDITAGSCAEVVFGFVTTNTGLVTPDVATALYAGIVAGTDSFQKPSTTPHSFQVAADLVGYKADRALVIQHVVKTKPLQLIKLTGLVYARLCYEEQAQLYWTTLEKNDFKDSRANHEDVPAVMRELTNNIAGFNAAFLLYEDPTDDPPATTATNFHVYLLLGRGLKTRQREIREVLSATKENGALVFKLTAPSLESAERQAHEKIKQILP